MSRGLFITLEGIEGVGKTTQLQRAQAYLSASGRELVVTREPGGTPVGEAIRNVLLDKTYTGMSVDAELLLMFAARAEHIAKVIKPALARGAIVLCDRFTDATYAYQGGGRQISLERIGALEDFVQHSLRPDCVLVLDAPVDAALARARKRSAEDRFEAETVAFFERVRALYLARANRFASHVVIDAQRSIDEVGAEIESALAQLLAGEARG
ncbi:MAG: dTMP kinase [Gammaproteobacteria bacterium]|nr:dTMP kinase [Gammaproteobacteria bacterium]